MSDTDNDPGDGFEDFDIVDDDEYTQFEQFTITRAGVDGDGYPSFLVERGNERFLLIAAVDVENSGPGVMFAEEVRERPTRSKPRP